MDLNIKFRLNKCRKKDASVTRLGNSETVFIPAAVSLLEKMKLRDPRKKNREMFLERIEMKREFGNLYKSFSGELWHSWRTLPDVAC